MKLFLTQDLFIDTSEPFDLSLPVNNNSSLRAWYLESPEITPVKTNEFLGSIEEGGSVNFRNIFFNPHGHGTHTECCGHITSEVFSINKSMTQFFVNAYVITVEPKRVWNEDYQVYDAVITEDQLRHELPVNIKTDALLIRTLPNQKRKKEINYSDTNPAFFEESVVDLLNELNVVHFLTDLPSVDRELDGGKLSFHHKYWNVPEQPDLKRTITELIYIDNNISDGSYLLDLQVAPFENDAAPSRPVIYKIKTVNI